MKKLISFSLLIIVGTNVFAKKVKFAVDMTGIPVNVTGMHIAGDFQIPAGYLANFDTGITPLIQETADTNIYSIIVDLPAFIKYEYFFVNGDQGYDAEFVPEKARVLYNFNSNRWLYVDSLASDTTFVGVLPFGGTAPKGKYLLRYEVNMQNEAIVSANGVHVGTNANFFSPSATRMYSFDGYIYEYIDYVDTSFTFHEFRFANGNTNVDFENVPGACNVFGNRETITPNDTILTAFCLSSCSACSATGIAEQSNTSKTKLSPNPTSSFSLLEFNDNNNSHLIQITNVLGSEVRTYSGVSGNSLRIEKDELKSGMYFITVLDSSKQLSRTKLIIE